MNEKIKDILNLIVGRLDKMDGRLDNVDSRLDKMDTRFDQVDSRLDNLETRQNESYAILKVLEENAKITRAEQDKMIHMVVDIQGKVNKLSNEVEDHDKVISQLKAIK